MNNLVDLKATDSFMKFFASVLIQIQPTYQQTLVNTLS